MKKLFMLLLATFAAMCCVSCSDDNDNDFPKEDPNDPNIVRTIMLTIEADGTFELTLDNEKWLDNLDEDSPLISSIGRIPFPKELSIDWGDGSVTSSNSHKYGAKGKYNVVISAKDLRWFACSDDYDKITAIDLKKCNSLVGLILTEQDVYEIDVAGFTELKYLSLYENDNLKYLNIDGCKKLEYCYCRYSELETLDIDDCKNLKILELRTNNLTELNIPKGSKLESLGLSYNEIAAIDVSNCPLLQRLYLVGNELTSLDISKCPALFFLNCYGNEFDTEALNKIFTDLPVVTSGDICIGVNPGTNTCDESIAKNKGWSIYYK